MTLPKFSLIIPCYNESKALPELISRADFVATKAKGEIIIVNNGSTDETEAVLNRILVDYARVRSVHVSKNQGYGYGILAGLAEAKAPIIGWTHADLQADPIDVLRALEVFESSGKTFVKGKRYGRSFGDKFFTFGMSVFETLLLRTKVSDINAQPTLFSRELFDSWQNAPWDFALDLYAYYTAQQQKYRVRKIPVLFLGRKFGHSSWNFGMKTRWKFISRTIRYSVKLRKTL